MECSVSTRWRRFPRPVRSSVRACERLSRRRSITVSPARAMPVRTVTVASAVATGSIAVNCPTVSSVSAAVAKTRMIVSTTGLNSGPGSGGGWWTHAAATMASAAGSGEPRPCRQRGEAGDREQHRPAGPPAAQREAAGHAGGADRLDRARSERHGHPGGGGGAHRGVEPRQPVHRPEAGEHEQRHGDGGDRTGGDRHPLRLTGQLRRRPRSRGRARAPPARRARDRAGRRHRRRPLPRGRRRPR